MLRGQFEYRGQGVRGVMVCTVQLGGTPVCA